MQSGLLLLVLDYNMFVLGTKTDTEFAFHTNGNTNHLAVQSDDVHLLEDLHLHCFTWKAGGYARVTQSVTADNVDIPSTI